ncbi:putative membrane protein [Alkalibacillus flavidus]|uniref:Membrane protein n=1 Tax=Alkalibacillus flavidus TaxID=546021 RepID=A0ABV2KU29_9BACI
MLEWIVLSGILGVGGYGLFRWRLVNNYRSQAREFLPSDKLQLNTYEQSWDTQHHRDNLHFMDGWKGAAAAGAIGQMPSLYYLSQVDPAVMDAMDFSFSEDLSNFNNMADYIDDKYLDVLGTDAAEGWMTRFEGYVMEMKSADALEKMGYDVQFPNNANNEGWDLLVDGEPWQIKGGESPSVIAEHFEKYPDVPVVTSSTLGEQFQANEHVMSFDELDPASIHETTHDSLSSIGDLNSADAMGGGIPLVSLAMSSVREIKLHSQGKTDMGSSMKNVSLDTAGVGAGGFAGAQAGVAVGTIGGPVGAAAGGMIGGIVGAVGGKMGTNTVKEKAMKEAYEVYENRAEEGHRLIEQAQKDEHQRLRQMVRGVNQDLNKARASLEKTYRNQFIKRMQNTSQAQRHFLMNIPGILQSIRHELKQIDHYIRRDYKPTSTIRQFLAPTYDDVAYKTIQQWLEERYDIIDEALHRYSHLEVDKLSDKEVGHIYAEAVRFFQEYNVESSQLENELKAIIDEAEYVNETGDAMKKDFYLHIIKAEEAIRQRTRTSFQFIVDKGNNIKDWIKEAEEKFLYEKGKLGK